MAYTPFMTTVEEDAVSGSTPEFSIVIPAWHEESNIGPLVEHIRRFDTASRCEVIVVDGDPTGTTLAALRDSGVTRLVSRKGRAHQMNAGAAAANGSVIVFLHADTMLPDSALDDIRRVMSQPGTIGGAFRLRFDSDRPIYRFMSWVISARTARSRLPYGDQAIFVYRRRFLELGGFAPIPIMEDVEFVRRIRRAGHGLVLTGTEVRTSCRRMEGEGVVRRVLKNTLMRLLFAVGVPARVLSRWYTDGHRLRDVQTEASEVVAGVALAPPPDGP